MKLIVAFIFALTVGSAIHSAQAESSDNTGRWCMVGLDSARHCYFRRHQDCVKAITGGGGVCVPDENRRGEMPEDSAK